MVKVYEVGGHVRDSLLGIKSKDIDCAVEASSWEEMRDWVIERADKICVEKPEYFTIRAIFDGEGRDFVLCRKDGEYLDGRRPEKVIQGTIYDDLARRDFTVNAIARCLETGKLLDPHNGQRDLSTMTLRAVGSAHERFMEDHLRIIRAIRFCITKGFTPDREIESILLDGTMADGLLSISTQRIAEELKKCTKYSTSATLRFLSLIHPLYIDAMFDGHNLWFDPSMKAR